MIHDSGVGSLHYTRPGLLHFRRVLHRSAYQRHSAACANTSRFATDEFPKSVIGTPAWIGAQNRNLKLLSFTPTLRHPHCRFRVAAVMPPKRKSTHAVRKTTAVSHTASARAPAASAPARLQRSDAAAASTQRGRTSDVTSAALPPPSPGTQQAVREAGPVTRSQSRLRTDVGLDSGLVAPSLATPQRSHATRRPARDGDSGEAGPSPAVKAARTERALAHIAAMTAASERAAAPSSGGSSRDVDTRQSATAEPEPVTAGAPSGASCGSPPRTPLKARVLAHTVGGLHIRTDEDVSTACHMIRGLVLASRTLLAQHRDVDGLLAQRRGIVCDARVLESAAAIAGFSISPLAVGHLGMLFPDIISVTWSMGKGDTQVLPRVQLLQQDSGTAAELEADLRRRHPTVESLASRVAQFRIPPPTVTTPAAPSPVCARPAAAPSLAGMRFAEAVANDVAIPTDLDGFLSESRAAALRQSLAFKRYTNENNVVAKTAVLSKLDTVLASYDRVRSHFARGSHAAGTHILATLLTFLNCDVRPLDLETGQRRLNTLLEFADSGLRSVATTEGQTVVAFDAATASRARLAAAVQSRSDTVKLGDHPTALP